MGGVICNLTVAWILTVPDLGDSTEYLSGALAPFFKILRIVQLTKKPKSNKTPLIIA